MNPYTDKVIPHHNIFVEGSLVILGALRGILVGMLVIGAIALICDWLR